MLPTLRAAWHTSVSLSVIRWLMALQQASRGSMGGGQAYQLCRSAERGNAHAARKLIPVMIGTMSAEAAPPPPVEQLQQVHIVRQAHGAFQPRQRPRQVQPHVGHRVPSQREGRLQQVCLRQLRKQQAEEIRDRRRRTHFEGTQVQMAWRGAGQFAGDGRSAAWLSSARRPTSCPPLHQHPFTHFDELAAEVLLRHGAKVHKCQAVAEALGL